MVSISGSLRILIRWRDGIAGQVLIHTPYVTFCERAETLPAKTGPETPSLNVANVCREYLGTSPCVTFGTVWRMLYARRNFFLYFQTATLPDVAINGRPRATAVCSRKGSGRTTVRTICHTQQRRERRTFLFRSLNCCSQTGNRTRCVLQ